MYHPLNCPTRFFESVTLVNQSKILIAFLFHRISRSLQTLHSKAMQSVFVRHETYAIVTSSLVLTSLSAVHARYRHTVVFKSLFTSPVQPYPHDYC